MAPTATPAASLPNQQDPYAKYGGSVAADPYAKYGGAAIAQPPAQNQAASQPSQATPESPIRLGPLGGNAQDAAIMQQTRKEYPNATSPRTIGAVAGSIVLPGAAPEAGWLAHAALTGLGGGLGTSAGQLAEGKNPLETPNLEESGTNAALFGLSDVLFGALPALAKSKAGRSFINESVGANGRDVIYGNPAKALTDEGISSPFTGDIEKVKAAAGDLTAAGGRLGDVAQRVSELQPQVNQALAQSTKTISVADAIDKPLTDAMNDIIGNSAMTDAEKMAAISQLGGLQASLKEGLGADISPLKANQLKNLVGSRVRWNGTNAIGDEVKPAYKAVYASLKGEVNGAVPEIADLNERLTNLYAAQDDLIRLARNEEVSRGAGAMRGTIGTSLLGKLEAGAGRFIPGASAGANAAGMAVKPNLPTLGSLLNPDLQIGR
jgi:hypothetical protein